MVDRGSVPKEARSPLTLERRLDALGLSLTDGAPPQAPPSAYLALVRRRRLIRDSLRAAPLSLAALVILAVLIRLSLVPGHPRTVPNRPMASADEGVSYADLRRQITTAEQAGSIVFQTRIPDAIPEHNQRPPTPASILSPEKMADLIGNE